MTAAQLNGRPVVVSGGADNAVRVWDLAPARRSVNPATDGGVQYPASVNPVAVAQVGDQPVGVVGGRDRRSPQR